MPYASVSELPPAVKSRYSSKCQRVFRGAFNATYPSQGEETAFKVAHAAARRCQGGVSEALVTAAARERAIRQARATEAANFKLTTDELVLLRNALRSASQATMERMVDTSKPWEYGQTKALMDELDAQLLRVDALMVEQTKGLQRAGFESGSGLLPSLMEQLKVSANFNPRVDSKMLDIAQATVPELISGVTKGVKTEVSRLLRNAALGQWPMHDLMQKIGTVTGKGPWATAFHRGEAIYRTEIGRLYQSSNLSRLEELGDMEEGWLKEWVSSEDPRVRFDHVRANGQRVKPTEPFIVGGEKAMYPLDPNLSARQSIFCRCLSVPWHPDFDTPVGAKAQAEPFDFDAALRELEKEQTWAQTKQRGTLGEYEQLRQSGRESPWRHVPGFTEAQLKQLARSSRNYANFLRLRYGIEARDIPYGHAGNADVRLGVLKALELYRKANARWVTESEYLKTIDFGKGVFSSSAGETSPTGKLTLIVERIKQWYSGKGRYSPNGRVEVVAHELGHAVGNLFGIRDPMAGGVGGKMKQMWKEWREIHDASMGIMNEAREKLATFERAAAVQQTRLAAAAAKVKQAGGTLEGDWHATGALRERARNEGWWYEREEYESVKSYTAVVDENLKRAREAIATGPARSIKSVDAYPTTYARDGVWGSPDSPYREDFAESLAAYLLQSEDFMRYCPQRVDWFRRWLK